VQSGQAALLLEQENARWQELIAENAQLIGEEELKQLQLESVRWQERMAT
jgi:hypothetical protein